MPIQRFFNVEKMSPERFHEVDFQVMRHAFEIQNELGRLCNEAVYQSELIHRCSNDGFTVLAEGEIVVSYKSFSKSYFLDALVNQGVVYELKAVVDLNGRHEAQLLNYLFLAGLQNGKLINFSSTSVQHRFVTTNIDSHTRLTFNFKEDSWDATIPSSGDLREIIRNLLNEWGAFLDISLYREAIFHFLGGEEKLLVPVNVSVGGRVVGHQKMCLVAENTGLHISSTVRHLDAYRKQLLKILEHTDLERIQWVNFSRDVIRLVTLVK
jgi:GxxExxY protein